MAKEESLSEEICSKVVEGSALYTYYVNNLRLYLSLNAISLLNLKIISKCKSYANILTIVFGLRELEITDIEHYNSYTIIS